MQQTKFLSCPHCNNKFMLTPKQIASLNGQTKSIAKRKAGKANMAIANKARLDKKIKERIDNAVKTTQRAEGNNIINMFIDKSYR